jgi:hypothetical protein
MPEPKPEPKKRTVANLTPQCLAQWATDTEGPTVPKTIKIETEMLEWLGTLDGDRAIARHIRTALKMYQKTFKQGKNK